MNTNRLILLSLLIFCFACSRQEENEQLDIEKTVGTSKQTEKANTPNNETETEIDYDTNGNSSRFGSGNNPPKIEEIAVQMINGNPRDGFKVHLKASDPEDDFIDFIYQWRYEGEDLIGETDETLSWKENFERGGEVGVEVIPYDNEAQGIWKSEGKFTIPNSPPVIESKPPNEISEGKFKYEVIASDPDGDKVSLSVNNAPEGMSFDEKSKTIEWNINDVDPGNYKTEIVVTDDQGAKITQILDLSVTREPES